MQDKIQITSSFRTADPGQRRQAVTAKIEKLINQQARRQAEKQSAGSKR